MSDAGHHDDGHGQDGHSIAAITEKATHAIEETYARHYEMLEEELARETERRIDAERRASDPPATDAGAGELLAVVGALEATAGQLREDVAHVNEGVAALREDAAGMRALLAQQNSTVNHLPYLAKQNGEEAREATRTSQHILRDALDATEARIVTTFDERLRAIEARLDEVQAREKDHADERTLFQRIMKII